MARQTSLIRWFAALVLIAAILLLVLALDGKSVTYDEVAHLPAGYSYLTVGVISLNLQHPPLIKEICAVPLLFLNLSAKVDHTVLENPGLEQSFEWTFGREFLFSQDAYRLLFWGRMPAILMYGALAALVMFWAARLWGPPAGLLALIVCAFNPTLSAHGMLITTDVGVALFSTLFLFWLRRYLQSRARRHLILSGFVLGLALGSKFSAIVLLPIAYLLVLLAVWKGGPADRGQNQSKVRSTKTLGKPRPERQRKFEDYFRPALSSTRSFLAMLGVALLTVWLIYLFSDPSLYWQGIRSINKDHDPNYPYFLLGELKSGGWWYYLPAAWLVKTPLPELVLLGLTCIAFLRGRRAAWLDEAFLFLPAAAYFLLYSMTADNVGVRYLIPCLPFVYISMGRVVHAIIRWKTAWLATLAVLLAWHVAEYAAVYPDQLSYFNQIAGGTEKGTEWLDDSNVDWGQSLIQLKEYLERNSISDFWLCYFGTADPAYYGVRGKNISRIADIAEPPQGTMILSGHCLARAKALLNQLYGQGPKNWLARTEPTAVVGHAYYVFRR
ncbi:MAG: glycosyltransferase family 39 protein [Acidobacteriota bacterium]